MQAALDRVAQLSTPTGQNLEIGIGEIPGVKTFAANSRTPRRTRPCWSLPLRPLRRAGITPNAVGWASVEANNPLKSMMTNILTGQMTVDQAAKDADTKINAVINGQ